MTAVVMDDSASTTGRLLRVEWTPEPSGRAAVSGDCAAGFKGALKRMHLGARHAVEFPITAAGEGRLSERLENYAGWTWNECPGLASP
jgi:hypothetical protein